MQDQWPYVSGYFISFETGRAYMKTLEIADRDCYDHQLYFPINNWLAEQNRTKPLVGAIIFPESGFKPSQKWHGLLLVSHIQKYVGESTSHEENDSDRRVKDWLIKEVGAKEDDLIWHSCVDRYGITSRGPVPYKNTYGGKEKKYQLNIDQLKRLFRSDLKPSEFIAQLRANGEEVVEDLE